MPKAALAKLSRDVRNTHFRLGEAGTDFETAHQQQFRKLAGLECVKPSPTANQSRQVHFALGADISSMNTETEAASRFKPFSVDSSPALTQEIKNQLRAHHFGLGHDRPSYISHNKEAFAPKVNSELNKTVDEGGRGSRKDHFQLGVDGTVKESEARANFTPKAMERAEGERELAERKRTQRLTHFQMGTAAQSFQSTAQAHFQGVPGHIGALDAPLEADLHRDHFSLGTHRPEMSTVAKEFFTGKTTPNAPLLNQQQVRDLRASHIVFGQGDTPVEPTYREFHKGGPVAIPTTRDPKTVRTSSLVLGSDRTQWTTVYNTMHQQTASTPAKLSPEGGQSLASHFVMGSDRTEQTTTSRRDYQRAMSTHANRLPAEDEKSLKGHHFQLGLDPSAHYSTSNTDYGAVGGSPSVMDAARKRDLQCVHFQYGSAETSFETNHRTAFGSKGGSVSPQRKRPDRKTNVTFGSQRGAWETTNAGTYQWIQPVPDLTYKFQIQY